METQIQIKINKEEKELIRKFSKRVGLGMSGYVRNLVLRQIYTEEATQKA